MFCINCGKENSKKTNFCETCGTTAPDPSSADITTVPNPAPANSIKRALLIVPFVSIAITVAAVFLFSMLNRYILLQNPAAVVQLIERQSQQIIQDEIAQEYRDAAMEAAYEFLSQYITFNRGVRIFQTTDDVDLSQFDYRTVLNVWSEDLGRAVYMDSLGYIITEAVFLENVDDEYFIAVNFALFDIYNNGIPIIWVVFSSQYTRMLIDAIYVFNGQEYVRTGTVALPVARSMQIDQYDNILLVGFDWRSSRDLGSRGIYFYYFDIAGNHIPKATISPPVFNENDESVTLTATNHVTGEINSVILTWEEWTGGHAGPFNVNVNINPFQNPNIVTIHGIPREFMYFPLVDIAVAQIREVESSNEFRRTLRSSMVQRFAGVYVSEMATNTMQAGINVAMVQEP